MSDPGADDRRPLFVVCEDGHEYTERFDRFLGSTFRFVRAGDGLEACAAVAAPAVAGLLLDLDFRRTPVDRLFDEHGPPAAPAPAPPEPNALRARAQNQGILILRHLRARGVTLPVLLFADLDDPGRAHHLEALLAPLEVVTSREGLGAIAARLRRLARG
jgi:hypothetical protein